MAKIAAEIVRLGVVRLDPHNTGNIDAARLAQLKQQVKTKMKAPGTDELEKLELADTLKETSQLQREAYRNCFLSHHGETAMMPLFGLHAYAEVGAAGGACE